MPATATERTRTTARAWRWLVVLVPGIALYFAPLPGFTPVQRHLLAVFIATIVGLVAQPIAMGACVLVALTVLALTRTLPAAAIFAGFSNATVWLIFTAFMFGRAVSVTGFGLRVAYLFIRAFARSPLTLAYSIAGADAVLAPFVPSDTARGGAIVFPIVRSVAEAFGSRPGETGRLGAFLILTGYHTTYVASAMFLTGMASNPLIADFARSIAHVELTWTKWALGAAVPGLLSLLLVPVLLRRLAPPDIRDTHAARALAADQLRRLGRLSSREKKLVAILIVVLAGWVTSPWHGVSNTFVALAGVSAILVLRVMSWDELLTQPALWDALIWFGGIIMIADELNKSGVIATVARAVFGHMQGWAWMTALVVFILLYLYVHYGFASMTAHIVALYPGFLAAALAAGIPPLLAALPLGYFSNLDAGLTHYGTGSAPIYFSGRYVSQATWWKVGFLVSLMNLALWLGVGLLWWKLIGYW